MSTTAHVEAQGLGPYLSGGGGMSIQSTPPGGSPYLYPGIGGESVAWLVGAGYVTSDRVAVGTEFGGATAVHGEQRGRISGLRSLYGQARYRRDHNVTFLTGNVRARIGARLAAIAGAGVSFIFTNEEWTEFHSPSEMLGPFQQRYISAYSTFMVGTQFTQAIGRRVRVSPALRYHLIGGNIDSSGDLALGSHVVRVLMLVDFGH